MIRCFMALALPEEVRSRLAVLQFLLPLPRRADLADLHLTLVFLGEQPDRVLAAIDEDMARLTQTPFAVTLRGAGLFGGARPHLAFADVAPSEPLDRLQAKCARIARQAGVAVEAQKFRPHVTLGRFPPPPPEDALKLERAIAAETGFAAGSFPVTGVTLYRSHPGEGPRYEPLVTWPI